MNSSPIASTTDYLTGQQERGYVEENKEIYTFARGVYWHAIQVWSKVNLTDTSVCGICSESLPSVTIEDKKEILLMGECGFTATNLLRDHSQKLDAIKRWIDAVYEGSTRTSCPVCVAPLRNEVSDFRDSIIWRGICGQEVVSKARQQGEILDSVGQEIELEIERQKARLQKLENMRKLSEKIERNMGIYAEMARSVDLKSVGTDESKIKKKPVLQFAAQERDTSMNYMPERSGGRNNGGESVTKTRGNQPENRGTHWPFLGKINQSAEYPLIPSIRQVGFGGVETVHIKSPDPHIVEICDARSNDSKEEQESTEKTENSRRRSQSQNRRSGRVAPETAQLEHMPLNASGASIKRSRATRQTTSRRSTSHGRKSRSVQEFG